MEKTRARHSTPRNETIHLKRRSNKAIPSSGERRKSKKLDDRVEGDKGKRKKSGKKKQKLFRPCSPASYPSPLPIFDGCHLNNDEGESEAPVLRKSPNNEVRNEIIEDREGPLDSHIGRKIKGTSQRYSPSETGVDLSLADEREDDSFYRFRIHYLIIHIAIMIADGLQGTHLYILYEGYGYSVASLYCLGFVSGAITSPFVGPLVDKIGRRNSAVAYCVFEIAINILEQYDILAGLIVSRVVGGITTNLLFTVFESWLVTEHRSRGFSEEKLETVLRDSVVASNFSAILSGCFAHYLALKFGPKGPFEGAVGCTFVALILVLTRWEENYGSGAPGVRSIRNYMSSAFTTIISDSKIYRIGIIQGLTEGALQTFVFLWSPALRHFANKLKENSPADGVIGLDSDGEPAYGLIFGAFMACGALGGLSEPYVRKNFVSFLFQNTTGQSKAKTDDVLIDSSINAGPRDVISHVRKSSTGSEDGCVSDSSDFTLEDDSLNSGKGSRLSFVPEESESNCDAVSEDEDEKPIGVELLAALCFSICAGLLSIPFFVDDSNPYSFTMSLISFLMYECIVGLYMPCEGVLRTVYMPNESICSLMTMLRVITNVAVALGVISTNYFPFKTAFAACSCALLIASCMQLSLVQKSEWDMLTRSLLGRLPILLDPLTSENISLSQVNSFQIVDFDKPECKVTPSSSVSSASEDENGSSHLLETTISSGIRRRIRQS